MAAAPAAITHRLDRLETSVNELIQKSRGIEPDPRQRDWNWANCGQLIKQTVENLSVHAVPEIQQQLEHLESEIKENGFEIKKVRGYIKDNGTRMVGVKQAIDARLRTLNKFRQETHCRLTAIEIQVAKQSTEVQAQVRQVANQVAKMEEKLTAREVKLKSYIAKRDEDLKASITAVTSKMKHEDARIRKQLQTNRRDAQTELHEELLPLKAKIDSMERKMDRMDTKIDAKFDQVLDALRSLQSTK